MNIISFILAILFLVTYFATEINSACLVNNCYIKNGYQIINNSNDYTDDLGDIPANFADQCCQRCIKVNNCTIWAFDGSSCFFSSNVSWTDYTLTRMDVANGGLILGSPFPY
jgi:hypothetical protein